MSPFLLMAYDPTVMEKTAHLDCYVNLCNLCFCHLSLLHIKSENMVKDIAHKVEAQCVSN